MKNKYSNFIIFPLVLGLMSGSLLLWLGLVHNAQLEFYQPSGEVDYIYCIKVFFSWFVMGVIAGAIMRAGYVWFKNFISRHVGNA